MVTYSPVVHTVQGAYTPYGQLFHSYMLGVHCTLASGSTAFIGVSLGMQRGLPLTKCLRPPPPPSLACRLITCDCFPGCPYMLICHCCIILLQIVRHCSCNKINNAQPSQPPKHVRATPTNRINLHPIGIKRNDLFSCLGLGHVVWAEQVFVSARSI